MTTELIDLTRDSDRNISSWGTCRVIYMTRSGEDYCRENAPHHLDRTHETACAWARGQFDLIADRAAREHVTGFRIEWW